MEDGNSIKSYRLTSIGLWQVCLKHADQEWCQGYTVIKGFMAARIFQCISLVSYVISFTLLILYGAFPLYGTRILIGTGSVVCVTAIANLLGLLSWAVGSGTSMQHGLSSSFGLAVLSFILSMISIVCLGIERLDCSHSKPKTNQMEIGYL